MTKVRKAVFPVAGLGTRSLPATKAMPKEMLTVVDRPLIQYVVDEALAAGIETLIFVTGRNKGTIEDYFDIQYELQTTLEARGKTKELELLAALQPAAGTAHFTRQQAPLGLGHAVWCAREIVAGEPFALLLPDVLVKAEKSCLAQMMDVYNEHGGNVIAVDKMPADQLHLYGVVDVTDPKGPGPVYEVKGMVEKPSRADAPSDLTITGRYILQPEVFDLLAKTEKGAGGEIQLTDAMQSLMANSKFSALVYEGELFDCGTKAGFLAANVGYALDRPDLKDTLTAYLKSLTL